MSCDSWLDKIQVAAPCSADWNEMAGDERARFCALCKKNVYNLSAMSRTEAKALIKEKEGKLCVRFYRREDGTVLTDNCPVGLRAIRRRLQWIGAGVAALLTFTAGIFVSAQQKTAAAGTKPTPRLFGWGSPPTPPPTNAVVGVLVCPPRPKPPATPVPAPNTSNQNTNNSGFNF